MDLTVIHRAREATQATETFVDGKKAGNPVTAVPEELNRWGHTKERAAEIARQALATEMASVEGSRHGNWNMAIQSAMLSAGEDPQKLFAMLAHLKAADLRIEYNGIPEQYRHLAGAITGGTEAGKPTVGNIGAADATPAAATGSPVRVQGV